MWGGSSKSGKDDTKVMTDIATPIGDKKANDTYDKTKEGDNLGGLVGLGSHEEYLKAEAEKNREPTKWERKKARILGESNAIRRNFFMGFAMGGCVGALMGGLTGTYFAF